MTGGSVNRRGGVISRGAEAESLKEKLAQARTALETAVKDRERARQRTVRAAEELERLKAAGPAEDPALQNEQRERDDEVTQARERLAAVQAELRAFVPLVERLTDQLSAAKAEQARQEERLSEYRREDVFLREQITAGKKRVEELEAQLETLGEEIRHATQEKLRLEGERSRADREAREKNDEQMRLQREAAALEQKKPQASMEESRLLDRLWDTYGMTHQAALAVRIPIESIPKANRKAAQLNKAIQDLGVVNIGAVNEYERLEERYAYLSGQRDDVETARQELEKIIEDITGEMEDIFRREFAKIQEAFAQTFADLFVGGKGALALEDENDALECGVEITVQPPGKNQRALSLLSGGERALVAIALYFAILKVHPTPFCVVDEIEAALDEANGARFIRYLRASVSETQFLLITHRRATMEASDVLYGVTMERQGVSRVLKLDMAQAEQLLGKEMN